MSSKIKLLGLMNRETRKTEILSDQSNFGISDRNFINDNSYGH